MTEKPSLTLRRRLHARPETVFRARTDPKHLMRWMGPEHVTMSIAETDLRVGGRFRFVMQAEDGEEHGVSGVYGEIVPDRKIVFSWAWRSTPERQSRVTVSIVPDGDHSILTLVHEQFFDAVARDRHEQGWSGALNKLESHLASSREG